MPDKSATIADAIHISPINLYAVYKSQSQLLKNMINKDRLFLRGYNNSLPIEKHYIGICAL
jgi:hypothetical protein